MLMTDQVHLAAQLEAEFTLAPRSFSLSLYSLTFLPPLSLFFPPVTSQHHFPLRVYTSVCVCQREGVKARVMVQLCFSISQPLCSAFACLYMRAGQCIHLDVGEGEGAVMFLQLQVAPGGVCIHLCV